MFSICLNFVYSFGMFPKMVFLLEFLIENFSIILLCDNRIFVKVSWFLDVFQYLFKFCNFSYLWHVLPLDFYGQNFCIIFFLDFKFSKKNYQFLKVFKYFWTKIVFLKKKETVSRKFGKKILTLLLPSLHHSNTLYHQLTLNFHLHHHLIHFLHHSSWSLHFSLSMFLEL